MGNTDSSQQEIITRLVTLKQNEFLNNAITNEKWKLNLFQNLDKKKKNELITKQFNQQEQIFKNKTLSLTKKYEKQINWQNKQLFLNSIIQNNQLRKEFFKIIKKFGLCQSIRWDLWKIILKSENNFQFDQTQQKKRKQIFQTLIKQKNKNTDQTVVKDITRTISEQSLFENIDSIGTQKLQNVCKAIGNFFPKVGYVQGMNFIAGFILQMSDLDDYESWSFIINLWKKKRNLYFGLYETGFPLQRFLCYAFFRSLDVISNRIYEKLKKIELAPELWLTKWFLSFFVLVLPYQYLLRCFDFLIISDVFGLVYISLVLVKQMEEFILKNDMAILCQTLQNKNKMSKLLDYKKFCKELKNFEFDKNH